MEGLLRLFSLNAAADLSAHQFAFVTIDTASRVNLTGAGLNADAVLQDTPAALDRAAALAFPGSITKILIGAGGLTKGDHVASGANGTAVTAASTNIILGTCIKGGLSGELGDMLFHPRGAA